MKIYDIAKCLSGNVLGIGVDGKISEILEKNDLVLNCNLLNSYTKEINKKQNIKQKLKKIRLKKIRKVFKKKKVDFIICNIEEIKKHLKTFIKDSIYINKDILYIYNITDDELKEELIKKYNRYNTKIEEIKDKNTTILKIDNKNAKTNIFKDYYYLIIDTLMQLFNLISDILLN
jgi:hypothetical protein